MKKIIKIRIVFGGILAFVVLWLLLKAIVPAGEILYSTDFNDKNYFLRKITPKERVLTVDTVLPNRIIGDPVYFNLRPVRGFDTAEMTFKFKNMTGLPLIEAGILVDKTTWRYDLKPLENEILNKLMLVWDVARDEELVLIERDTLSSTTKYASIAEFLENPPESDRIAVYNYDLNIDYVLPDYEANEKIIELPFSLRGAYQFFTYIKNEELSVNFSFLDLNQNKDADAIEILLWLNNELLDSRRLEDDGVAVDNRRESDLMNFTYTMPDLPKGIYKIEVKVNDDIVTTALKTKQKKFSFFGSIWLWRGQAIDFFTDSTLINIKTVNPESLQVVRTSKQEVEINETYKQFSLRSVKATTTLSVEKEDVILAFNGSLSLSSEAHINPRFKQVGPELDINASKIDYVIARYSGPRVEEYHKIATVVFDLKKAYHENKSYSIILSIPGLKAEENDNSKYFEIESISVKLNGKSIYNKFKEMFASIL